MRALQAPPGTLIVAVEMPDLAALAKVDELQKSNTEIAATMQKIGALRKIVSDSLYEEVNSLAAATGARASGRPPSLARAGLAGPEIGEI